MKTNKIEAVPRLRFSEFRGNENWNESCFKEVISVIDGDRGKNYPKSEEFSQVGYCLFLSAKNVTKQGFAFENVQFITEEKDKAMSKGKLKRNDIVLTTRGSIGQFAYYSSSINYENVRINSGMVLLRAKSNVIDSKYLYYFCQAPVLTKHIEDVAYGNAQQQLNVSGIKKFVISYSELVEQQKIADCLSSLDTLINAENEQLDTLKEYKAGLLQQLFPAKGETTPKRRFVEFEGDGDWEEVSLIQACDMKAGTFIAASEIQDTSKSDLYPCYGGNGLRGFTKTYTHNGVFPLVGRQGALCGNINLVEGKFHATEHALVCTPDLNIDVIWLYYQLVLLDLNKYATGQAQPGLSVKNLNNITLRVPDSLKEQQKIADCLSSLCNLIESQDNKIKTLKKHKQGLMQQLFPVIKH
ncbi:restriction endonuclease subunit S [uncultured Psychrobacter sp.]|uniref:restriction endonuclease subunit S n=1 Tax=uncultured Psychrobacter sp. TaxID=259303 RepID=UPI003459F068